MTDPRAPRHHRWSIAVTGGMTLLFLGCAPQQDSSAPSSQLTAATTTATPATPATPTTPPPAADASRSATPPATATKSPSASAGSTPAIPGCSPSQLQTRVPGTLTMATSQPAFEPWMVANDPTNGKGFESAVAYAVAGQLGYDRADVAWSRVDFNAAVQPGPKPFDTDINQFSITPERRQAVDFSSSYYSIPQAVLVRDDAIPAQASIAALRQLRLGAQVGTTSYTAITSQIRPTRQPRAYNDNSAAAQALSNGQIQALVVDLPTALYLASAQLKGVRVFGQLPPSGGTPDQLAFVLDKGSPLTGCVSKAVDRLRSDGTLSRLATRWLTNSAGAPVLR